MRDTPRPGIFLDVTENGCIHDMPHGPSWQARKGQVLRDRFELSQPLGQGGMGEVWRARDRALGVDIALKLLHPELARAPAQVEFLRNECRLARSLNHPHIVQVYDFHQDGEIVFISMAWVDGPNFDCWSRAQERPWSDRLRPLMPAARALDYVHEKGLVHRDVKGRQSAAGPAGPPVLDRFRHCRGNADGVRPRHPLFRRFPVLHEPPAARRPAAPPQRRHL